MLTEDELPLKAGQARRVEACYDNVHHNSLDARNILFLSTALRSAFATVVSADKRSSRGAASVNLPITATGRASVPAGLSTSRSAAPSKPTAKRPTRAFGKSREELKKG